MCGTGKACHECTEGPCGPGGDFMRKGRSYTRCSVCGKDFSYGSYCQNCKDGKIGGERNGHN